MTWKIAIAAVAVTAGLGLIDTGKAHAGLVCKAMTWGYGLHGTKAISRGMAMNTWKANAGPAWNNWSLAKSKTQFCRLEGSKWHCVAKAQPCRELGLGG